MARFSEESVPTRAFLPYAFLLTLLAVANGFRPKRGWRPWGRCSRGLASLLLSAAFAALLFGLGGRAVGRPPGRRSSSGCRWRARWWRSCLRAGRRLRGPRAAGFGGGVFGPFYVAVAPVLGSRGAAPAPTRPRTRYSCPCVEAARGLGLSEAFVAAIQRTSPAVTRACRTAAREVLRPPSASSGVRARSPARRSPDRGFGRDPGPRGRLAG